MYCIFFFFLSQKRPLQPFATEMLHKRFRQHQESDDSEQNLCKAHPPHLFSHTHALAFAVGNVHVNDDIQCSDS